MKLWAAMEDPELFAPFFQGSSWDTWKVFLRAIQGEPLSEQQLAVFQHHTGRITPPTRAFDEIAVICGRRAGKSRVLATIATYLATIPDYSDRLAPGERASVRIIASDRVQARNIFSFILGMLNGIALFSDLIENETKDEIVLKNNVSIGINTASYRGTRGLSMACCLCDEMAFWRDTNSANPDEAILEAIRPALSNLNGTLIMASSPYSKRGALYQAWVENYAKDDAEMLVWTGKTTELNPTMIGSPRIAKAFKLDPVAAESEYNAAWRGDVSAFLSRDIVDSVTMFGCYEIPPDGDQHWAFVDASGGSSDSMTVAISKRQGDQAVVCAVREYVPPFSPSSVVADICKLLKTYNITSVTGDAYAGEWPRERFSEHSISYHRSPRPKSEIYRDALALFNSKRCQIIQNERLTSQLCALERRRGRGGKDTVDHPPKGRDDLANAVSGSLLMTEGSGGYDLNLSLIDALADLAAGF